ncbi:unnamed protein product [Leuciscus chuanchicus]
MASSNEPPSASTSVMGVKVDAEFLELALAPIFSEEGSLQRHRECRIINFLQDFIQKLEDDEELATAEKEEGVGNINQNSTTVSSFFQWLTGQAHIPLASQREGFKIQNINEDLFDEI